MKQNSDLESIYEYMRESGDLYEVLPEASGTYAIDKKIFKDAYKGINYFIKDEDEFN